MRLPHDILSGLCSPSLYWCHNANRFVNRIHQKDALSESLSTWLYELDSRQNVYAYRRNSVDPTVICRWNESEGFTIKKVISPQGIKYSVHFEFDYNRAIRWTLQELHGKWSLECEPL